jgi:hypothetical protein
MSRDAIRYRIKALPKMAEAASQGARLRDACMLIIAFQNGIITRSFRLAPLEGRTIRRKRRLGFPAPATPLLGEGGPGSYVMSLRKYPVKHGYIVKFPKTKLKNSELTAAEMHDVHEYGAVIRHVSGTVFRIPPRPAFTKAYAVVMRGIDDPSEEVIAVCMEYLRDGRSETRARIEANAKKLEAMIGTQG